MRVRAGAEPQVRGGEVGWVVGIFDDQSRRGDYFTKFPAGVVYTVELEDGSSIEVHESVLEEI